VTTGPGPRPVRTVFLGSGRFGVESLWRLDTSDEVDVVGVVTAPPRPSGRRGLLTRTPIHLAAEELAMSPILTPERLRSTESIAEVLALGPELLILADYGQIVPEALLGLPHGALNLHPSLLPRYRGATPIQAAILGADTETGVTLMQMDAGLDTGPIVAQTREPLTGTESAPELEERLEMAADGLLHANLGPWLRGEVVAKPQSEVGVSVTRQLSREDGRLDPGRPASALERQIRAYDPWPGTFVETTMFGRLIVDDATTGPAESDDIPGHLVGDGDGLAITTSDGRLRLGRVRVAGRKPMTAAELRRGAPGLVGSLVR